MTAQGGGTQSTAGRARPTLNAEHRIVGLVVHGAGALTAGSTLRSVVENFFPLIRARIDSEHAGIDVKPLDDEGTPVVRLSFRKWLSATSYDRYELVVHEVHWSQVFQPPSFGGLTAGLVKLLTTWLRRVSWQKPTSRINPFFWLLMRLLARIGSDILLVILMIVTIPFFLPLILVAMIGGWAGWLRAPGPLLRGIVSLYARLQPLVVELAVFISWPLIVLTYIALVVLESMGPLRELLPDAVGKARRSLVSIATTHLGDIWAYVGQPWEASQIRTRFERRFRELVEKEGKNAEAMFVIAHSLGCPVSYEAMSGGRMTKYIADWFGPRPLYYFTVGSALPAIWRVVPDEEKERLYRPLPKQVWWEDFISKYDPVRSDFIVRSVCQPAGVSTPAVSHTVVNQMDLLSEHDAYWNNAEQVLAPILDAITGGAFHKELQLGCDEQR